MLWPLKKVESALILTFCDRKYQLVVLVVLVALDVLVVLQSHFTLFTYLILFVVLGEPNFRNIADVDTPSGFSSALESTELTNEASGVSSNFTSAPSDSTSSSSGDVFGSSDVLSSTVRDGASIPEEATVEISVIQSTNIFFCEKCGDVLQM